MTKSNYFSDKKKSFDDTLFSISNLMKRFQVDISRKDIDKNYLSNRLTYWIETLENLRHEVMMSKSDEK